LRDRNPWKAARQGRPSERQGWLTASTRDDVAKQLSKTELDVMIWCLDELLERFDQVEAAYRFESGQPPATAADVERLRTKLLRLLNPGDAERG
jgi:hypothetical protein